MGQDSASDNAPMEQVMQTFGRSTGRRSLAEEKIRKLLDGMRREGRLLNTIIKFVKLLSFVAFLIILGLTVGLMVVFLPPLSWLGVIALAVVFLLWTMPDLPLVRNQTVVVLFYIALATQFLLPAYYAFALPGLPWISLRRMAWFPMALAMCLLIASSSAARAAIANAIGGAKLVAIPAICFIIFQLLSIFTSISFTESLKDVANSFLYWYVALLACIFCVNNERSIRSIFWIIAWVCISAGALGFAEFLLQTRIIPKLWPEELIAQLFAANPEVFEEIVRPTWRFGQFRSNFIYNVSLSYGEFLAVCLPLCLYFILHGVRTAEKIVGGIAAAACLVGVFASGARGAMLGVAVSVPLTFVFWIARSYKRSPTSMAAPLVVVMFVIGLAGFLTLFAASHSFQVRFTGGGESASSNMSRFDQWHLAVPRILANPITGNGSGLGAEIVGYAPFGGLTVDSYVISLLVEIGVLGFIGFFSMIFIAVFCLYKAYLTLDDSKFNFAGPLASALVSFGIYRLVLSQRENHVLFFVLIGIAMVLIASANNTRHSVPRQQA